MNKPRAVAVVAALACGVVAGAAGAACVAGLWGRRRPVPPSPLQLPRARGLARLAGDVRSAAIVAVESAIPMQFGATYQTIRSGAPARWTFPIVTAGTLAALTGAFLIGLALMNPEITALAAPSVAYPGTTATISYAAAGFGSVSYRLDAPSGHRAGSLSAQQGAIVVPIAQRDARGDVVVVLRAAGPFGADVRVARIKVLARPTAVVVRVPSDAARIDALHLSSTTAASGARIGLRYRSNATSGNVLLRDARGGTWANEPLNGAGYTELRLPVVERDTSFSVILQATRNGRQIENSVALFVTGAAPIVKSNATTSRGAMPAATLDIPAVAQSGATVVTMAGAGRAAAVIELTDKAGIALQRATPRTDGTTRLLMPKVNVPQMYLVSVSYQNGAGRESSFHWVRVLPAIPMNRIRTSAKR